MKLAITFSGFVAAGLTTLVSSVNSPVDPRHIFGTYLPEPQDLQNLTPRGTDRLRKPTLGDWLSNQQSRDKSASKNPPGKTGANKQTQTQSSSRHLPNIPEAASSSKRDNADPPAQKPQGESRPSTGPNRFDKPGAPGLMHRYLQQNQEQQSASQINRAPELPNLMGRPQNSLPTTIDQDVVQQAYLRSRDAHLLRITRNAAERNLLRHHAQEYEKSRDHVGWGGMVIPQQSPEEKPAPEVLMGPNGFPNRVIQSSQVGDVPNMRANHNPNPRLDPRDIGNGMSSPLSHQLAGRSSAQVQRYAADPLRARRIPTGGPSGMTIRPRPTVEERLAWVGGPSRPASETRQRTASPPAAGGEHTTSRSQASSGEQVGGREQVRQTGRATTPPRSSSSRELPESSSMSFIEHHRLRHPLLNSLPKSIDGSVSPGSSRSSSPRSRYARSIPWDMPEFDN